MKFHSTEMLASFARIFAALLFVVSTLAPDLAFGIGGKGLQKKIERARENNQRNYCPVCTNSGRTVELKDDGSCPDAANHPKPEQPSQTSDTLLGIIAFVVVALIVKSISRSRGGGIPEGWKSPPGHSEIWFGPPLGVKDGGNGGFSEVCPALRKIGSRVENARYILKYPRAGAEASIRQSVIFEAAVLGYLEKSGYRSAPLCRGQGKALSPVMRVPWYVMSCAPGQSLNSLMDGWAGRPFENGEAGRMLLALCDALVKLHKVGVCHRDIKPRNIFWDGSRVTIIDFGSARVPGEANPAEGNIPGTDRWEAPEQAYGSTSVGPMADIYSFGLIFCSVVLSKPYLEDRWSPLRAKYGAAVSAVVGGAIAEILFSRLLADDPQARIYSLETLSECLRKEWPR